MRLLKVCFFGGAFAALLSVPAPLQAAFIDPADGTGTFGTDPGTWAASFPALNTNATATARTTTPWVRGSANTTYQGWDRFFTPIDPLTMLPYPIVGYPVTPNNSSSPNEVDTNPQNSNGSATFTETLPGAFLTGGGNIYSPSTSTAFSVAVPNANLGVGFQTNFLVQVRAATGNFDFSSFQVNGIAISTLANYSQQLLDSFNYNAGFGFTDALDYKLEFTLPGNSALDTITFASAGSGLSFDKLSVDTSVTAIPEPSSLVSAGFCGLAGLLVLHRRMSRR